MFGDGTQKFCTLDNIQNILFETFTSASSFIKHPRHSVELPNNGNLVSNRSRAFVIFDRTTATYFSGFHTTQNYETYRKQFGKNLGSYTTSEVPDFTYKIEKAQRFFSKEGAESLIKKIQDVCNPLEIIEHLFNN